MDTSSRFQHDHLFEDIDGQTLMVDVVRFSMRFGPVGRVIGKQVVVPHVMQLLVGRLALLKRDCGGTGLGAVCRECGADGGSGRGKASQHDVTVINGAHSTSQCASYA